VSGAAQAARAVLTEFLPAYLRGGRVPVGHPLGVAEVAALEALIAEVGAPPELALARRREAARIAMPSAELGLEPAEATVVAVVHNLLALGDPELNRAGGRLLGRRKAARYTAALSASLPEPRSADDALAAHALVGPLLSARRVDALLKFWAGRVRYPGRTAPSRATRLPRLRRVRVEEVDVPAFDPRSDADGVSALRHLLRYSPLTNLLHPDRDLPPFRLEGLSACLANPALCRGVMRAWLTAPDVADLGGRIVKALLQRLLDPIDDAEVRLWLHGCYHLHLAGQHEALVQREPPPQPGGPGCVATTEASRWHMAMFKVLHRYREIFDLPGEAGLGPDLVARLTAYDAALKATVTGEEEREIRGALKSRFRMLDFPTQPKEASERAPDDAESATEEVVLRG
jgi:hypothetical protein